MTDLLAQHDNEHFDLESEPLDVPAPFDTDWGGDGSDLTRPVRAHVLQTLRVETEPYSEPVRALLTLGNVHEQRRGEQRQALQLQQEHAAELMRMARDRALYTALEDNPELWAPLHAIKALEELDASSFISDLIALFDLQEDFLYTHLPRLFAKIGSAAFEPLRDYLADQSRWYTGRAIACEALTMLAEQYPELREQVIEALTDTLTRAEHERITTAAMGHLVNLKALEKLPLIRQAFEQGQIDEMMYGDWGRILEKLGVEPEPDDALIAESRRRIEERRDRIMPRAKREEIIQSMKYFAQRKEQEQARLREAEQRRKAAEERRRSAKNKHKAASAARKANKRKRK